jgi:NAD(P)-dependent dehydrogenase (short-subunit alcohol dehydrogenase family)
MILGERATGHQWGSLPRTPVVWRAARDALRAAGIRVRMATKTAIVTGSNTGIGKATALGLAKQGFQVVLAVRDTAKGDAARAEIVAQSGSDGVVVMPLDLGDFASIRAFAAAFVGRFQRLDVLVNNAGVTARKRTTTKDGLETTFGVNHVGTALLTRELLPVLERSAPARIVVVSSGLHYRGKMAWDDPQQTRGPFRGLSAYNQSKLANVLFTKALARRLQGKGVTVNALHPGVVATELTREYPKAIAALFKLFLISPERGAECSLYVATSPDLAETTGAYFEKSRAKPASRDARDEAQQERLWQLTEEIIANPSQRRAA